MKKSAWMDMEKAEKLKKEMYTPEGLDVMKASEYQDTKDKLLWGKYLERMRGARGIKEKPQANPWLDLASNLGSAYTEKELGGK